MISLKLRLIREHNRIYKCWMRFLWHWYGKDAPIVLMVHGFKSSDVECKGAFMMTGSSFEQLMRFFFTKGWTALTQEELLEKVDRREWQQKCFHLTLPFL